MPFQLSTIQRALVVGAASAGLLIGAFSIGASQGSAAPRAAGTSPGIAAAPAAAGGRITVTGTGTVTGTPNQLLLSMGVQTSGASVSAALRQANHAVRAVTRALGGQGVQSADIQTSGLSIQPTYGGNSSAPTGYGVSESIQVTLRNLAKAGSQISAAARAGGNATVIDNVSLNLADTSSLLASARTKAAGDAKTKAAQYARAVGRPLGAVISMSEVAPPQPLPIFGYGVAASGTAVPRPTVPVHPGSQQLTVTVTAIFALG